MSICWTVSYVGTDLGGTRQIFALGTFVSRYNIAGTALQPVQKLWDPTVDTWEKFPALKFPRRWGGTQIWHWATVGDCHYFLPPSHFFVRVLDLRMINSVMCLRVWKELVLCHLPWFFGIALFSLSDRRKYYGPLLYIQRVLYRVHMHAVVDRHFSSVLL